MPHSQKDNGSSHKKTSKHKRDRKARHIERLWSVRRFRADTENGLAYIEMTFPSEGNAVSHLCIKSSDLRHPKKLLDDLANRLPIFPHSANMNDNNRIEFIRALVASSRELEVLPSKTGFINKTAFATYGEMIYADGIRKRRPLIDGCEEQFVDVLGTPKGTRQGLLKTARYSTYLAFAIGAALAAPLRSYIRLYGSASRQHSSFMSEGAIFNFSGPSSSGKTTSLLSAMSLAGSPERVGTFDSSKRGLGETASDTNDLPAAVDDTEKAAEEFVSVLQDMVHMMTGGRSRKISRGVQSFPPLRWNTTSFLTSSPRPIYHLAEENGWQMSRDDQVRLFDIDVPGPDRGGIFDRIKGSRKKRSKRSRKLIALVERSYSNHQGHTIPEWVLFLMQEDRSAEISKLIKAFLDHVASGLDGWEVRFARKFAVVYAATMLGVRAGILPWPSDLPLQVVTKCYRDARRAARTEDERASEAIKQLYKLLNEEGRVVDVPRKPTGKPTRIPDACIGIRFTSGVQRKLGVFDDALLAMLRTQKAKLAFTRLLEERGIVLSGHGHAGTVQRRIPIERDGRVIDRPRLWLIDIDRLKEATQRRA